MPPSFWSIRHISPNEAVPQGAASSYEAALSIVLESPHPLRPVFGLDAAGLGPGVRCVEFAAPLQRPELFEAHLAHGPIEEKAVDGAVVTVYAERLHAGPLERRQVEGLVIRGRLVLWRPPR